MSDSVLGFALATTGPLLISTERPNGQGRPSARLAPGMAAFLAPDSRFQVSGIVAPPVPYVAIELVPAGVVNDVGDAQILFASDPFPLAGQPREVDLVSASLRAEQAVELPETGSPITVFATAGSIEVGPAGSDAPGTVLNVGEFTTVVGGALTVRVGEGEEADVVAALLGPVIEIEAGGWRPRRGA